MAEAESTLYLDLDGTLLDIRSKYYTLYSRIVTDLGAQPLSQAAFWELKRRAAPPECILPGLDADGREQYSRRWLAAIETPAFTRLDTLLPGAREALADLRRRSSLVLATMRHDEAVLTADLRRLRMHGSSAVSSPPPAVRPATQRRLRSFGSRPPSTAPAPSLSATRRRT